MTLARRIVSLLPSATEMLFALGLGEAVVAVSHECDFPPAAVALQRATRSLVDSTATSQQIDDQVRERLSAGLPLYEVDAALLVELAPDLIVTQAQCDVCAVRLADVMNVFESEPTLAATRVVSLNPQSLDEVLNDIERVGAAAGYAERARAYTASLRARVEAIRHRTADLPAADRPRVAAIEWTEPLMIAGNWTPQLIDWAGGTQTLTRAGHHSPYTPWEDVQRFAPEVVVIMPCGFDLRRSLAELPTLEALPGWSELPAVRAGRVYAVDGNALFNRAGPRLVDSLELLAKLLHPTRFDDLRVGEPAHWQRVLPIQAGGSAARPNMD